MTEVQQPRPTAKRRNGAAAKRDTRLVPDDIVSGNGLAVHLAMTGQNVRLLTATGVLEKRSDGCFNLTANRVRYIKHLREQHRHTPRSTADAKHIAIKTAVLEQRLLEKQRRLVPFETYEEMIDSLCGLVLTHLSGLPARAAGTDLPLRRRLDGVVREVRVAMSEAATKMIDENGPPPDQQDRPAAEATA